MSLDHVDEIAHEPRLLFAKPWDRFVVRHGDPRSPYSYSVFAEDVAPELSHRVRGIHRHNTLVTD
jgi:hypothetical protein